MDNNAEEKSKVSNTEKVKKGKKKKDYVSIEIADKEVQSVPIESIDPSTGSKIYNNWTNKNIKTVRNWKTSISKASFIYEIVLEKYKKRVDNILLWAFILSTIATIISAITSALLTIDDTSYKWIAFGFNVALFVINGATTVLNGAIKIYKWDELVTSLSNFIEKMDLFYANISSELVLPDTLRQDAVEFIKKEDQAYLTIMQQSPKIYASDTKMANNMYEEFIKDNSMNFKYAQRYNATDDAIDIV
jgi:hypothetical protein